MSTAHHETELEPHVHSHDHGHGHGGEAHGSLKGYMIGFVLSIILTAIPFWIVMGGVMTSNQTAAVVVLAFALVQIVVHVIYFLHMNSSSEGGWNMLAMIFTAVLVLITIVGSFWVMYHMNHLMMPQMHEMSASDAHDMP
ncbi:cytochrome o ubiquinol oxidase subunit IV [Solimonas marina]|uniref:Cytochrome bo(3) ubiquinol oxidase subunit 4 n=1 Tax=Solimonas marina TaxID=2714601 RepID=A0A969W8K0_9GAMM|nr:cytochrome o ubiquinol oxidase subunit IV [Solimonas marina]NKF21499.1 cytochrome o ubiquinol oxidase subunit IV [Solimonas marina]